MTARIFTVSQLNGFIKSYIDLNPALADISVTGELSNYKQYPSGHHYFTLKDAESSISCVMFRMDAMRNLHFAPQNGMKVTVMGRVSVYPRDGKYQLICNAMLPAGQGDLQLAFEQLREKLESEGLFAEEHKKPLPQYPRKIAVITSGSGAAVHDVIRILGERWPLADVLVVPAAVQGDSCPGEIIEAIKYVNKYKLADLIITGRGGGSREDLWGFNSEELARTIYASQIPVISAVGHEPDVTIADYVADRRASTPSNGAEIAVPDRCDVIELLNLHRRRLEKSERNLLETKRKALEKCAQSRVMSKPDEVFAVLQLRLDRASERLLDAERRIITDGASRLGRLSASLDAMSPLKVLARGYSIATEEDGTVINSINQVENGAGINLRLSDGVAECLVTGVKAP